MFVKNTEKGQFWMGSQALRDAVNSENDENSAAWGMLLWKAIKYAVFCSYFRKMLDKSEKVCYNTDVRQKLTEFLKNNA